MERQAAASLGAVGPQAGGRAGPEAEGGPGSRSSWKHGLPGLRSRTGAAWSGGGEHVGPAAMNMVGDLYECFTYWRQVTSASGRQGIVPSCL